ncbi:histidine phosphatase family protein [Lactiplantibacillus garii]|uniref:Histidine phosphatase family protein n=1 Tax=Lactiplantibacillus garii TaxID=2306423 RepID=A0A3R8KE34_9LACO|nr:histidine phosphatase family protein [Lactiplantibacillus garii]RRK10164.1 histidine phosphatase family protein [Lactiplantibacillus garii]
MRIYLVRHGVTEFNSSHRFQGGQVNSPLLTEGVERAKQLGKYLADQQFTSVFSSPQGRALDTAKLILNERVTSPEITIVPDLREFEFGIWDGKPEQLVMDNPQYDYLIREPDKYNPKLAGGGETYDNFLSRTTKVIKAIVQNEGPNNSNSVLVVSHGNVISMTVKYLLGVPFANLRQDICHSDSGDTLKTAGHGIVDNDSLTVIETIDNETFKLKVWNKVIPLNSK